MDVTVMDERGRVTIGKELGKKFGRVFFVVPTYNEIVLMPKPKDPLKALEEWGRKSGINKLSMAQINKIVETEATREAMGNLRKAKK